ncbi:LOW QUALITY PROTEIN: transmembrane and immunoglobulin domain-containing protein 2 [Panthera pardus]|uniref:LOW QUALITY PROTEIN: transmembrane and immunoglobulin domain-containing protein 2 n=1 Tax=Panthera pardus TaxID=9691 RepID=UPI0023806825|nr:LOW QUALITY PROTEIN: transmembrane and immunoglobulin domain-containing protein 2 [Panthera pardus]
MEPLGTALVFLVQFWVLQGTAGLSVQQGPKLPQVREDSQVTLARQVVQSQAWGQQLRVGGKKDGVFLCDSHVTKGRFSLGVRGPRWQLSWESRGNLNLRGPRDPQRHNVTPASSSLQLASPPRNGFWNSFSAARRDQLQCSSSADRLLPNANHTSSHPGLLVAPPVAGAVAVAVAVAAGAGTQGILSRVTSSTSPGGAQRRLRRGQWRGRCWTSPRRSRRVYSISFPQTPRPRPQPRLAQKPCPSPSPGPPISTVGVSPDPRPSGQQKPRGLLEEGSEPRKETHSPPSPPPPVAT